MTSHNPKHVALVPFIVLFLILAGPGLGQPAQNNGPKLVTNSVGMKLVGIPAGEFLMGASESDHDAERDEKPQHRVRITQPFFIGMYEVTQSQFKQVMGVNRSRFSPAGQGHQQFGTQDPGRIPVETVSWEDAVEFCDRLSALPAEQAAGRVYRLPTEAEWEFACRGGTTTKWYFGESAAELKEHAWLKNNSHQSTHMVGGKQPNPFGLYDMYGNVWEWCADWYDKDYYKQSPATDPTGPSTGAVARVARGGSWFTNASSFRSSDRFSTHPKQRNYYFGFRVVLSGRRS